MTTTRDKNLNLIRAGHFVNVRRRTRGRWEDRGELIEVQDQGRLVLIHSELDDQLRTYPAHHCCLTSPWK